jgi:hypothetical protein
MRSSLTTYSLFFVMLSSIFVSTGLSQYVTMQYLQSWGNTNMPPSKLQPTTFIIENQLTTVSGGAPYWDQPGSSHWNDYMNKGTSYAYHDTLRVWAAAHNVRLIQGALYNPGSGSWGGSFYTYIADTTVGGACDGLVNAQVASCDLTGATGIEIDMEYLPNSVAARNQFDYYIRKMRTVTAGRTPSFVIIVTGSQWWWWGANQATPFVWTWTINNCDYVTQMLYNMERSSKATYNSPLHVYPGGPSGGYGSLSYWDDPRMLYEYNTSGVPTNKMVPLMSGEVKYYTGGYTPGAAASEQGSYHSLTEWPASWTDPQYFHWDEAAGCNYFTDNSTFFIVPESYSSAVAHVKYLQTTLGNDGKHFGGIGIYDVGRVFDYRKAIPDSAIRGMVTMTGGGPPPPPPTYKLKGTLFYDKNSNGLQDGNEPGLSGWTVNLTGPANKTDLSDSSGQYIFDSLASGTYHISQDVRPQWVQTYPASNGTYTITVPPSGDANFGNFSVTAIPISINKNWNVLSLPAVVLDSKISTLFPTATSQGFSYLGAYSPVNNFFPGAGYFIRFGFNQTEFVLGQPLDADTIVLANGEWNLIGSVGHPVAATSLQTIPPGIIDSKLFGFNNGLFLTDTIQPGYGFWIKLTSPGSIILPPASAQQFIPPKESADFVGMNAVSFRTALGYTQTLYFGENTTVPGLEAEYKLPPSFPGVFSAQFTGYSGPATMMRVIPKGTSGVYQLPVTLQAVDFPLTVNVQLSHPGGYSYFLSDDATSYPLTDGKTIVIQGDSTQGPVTKTWLLTVSSSSALPTVYALTQNYPNPFNPGTAINFEIPQTSRVRLEIFNLLGEKVATLIDREMGGGYYSVPFDGSHFSSGIYYYRLLAQAGTSDVVQLTKKMLLVK